MNFGLGWRPGGSRGLQIRKQGVDSVPGEFDSHTSPFFNFTYRSYVINTKKI